MNWIYLGFILSLLTLNQSIAQSSKKELIELINEWYDTNADLYLLSIHGKNATAHITRYHPERANEKNDLIEVHHKGMKVTLKFDAPIEKITTHKDSLQKHFSYLSITNLYNEIPATGWHVSPKTPSSSLRGKGIEFTEGGESISIEIQWSIFAVTGYRDTKNVIKKELLQTEA